MANIDKIIELLCEKFEDTPMGVLVIFFIMLTGITIVVDTMLTHTFPAYTLIALLLFAGNIGMKAYTGYLRNKNRPWDKTVITANVDNNK